MQRTQIIRCPNCGSVATRHFSNDQQGTGEIIHTECPVCDYLMVMHSLDGTVVEAYAPGISTGWNQKLIVNSPVETTGVTNIGDRRVRSRVKNPAA
ncbi:MAG: hypothetical protein AAF316_07180 [Cyanobacteria bacterium P01_A01_bin.80]